MLSEAALVIPIEFIRPEMKCKLYFAQVVAHEPKPPFNKIIDLYDICGVILQSLLYGLWLIRTTIIYDFTLHYGVRSYTKKCIFPKS